MLDTCPGLLPASGQIILGSRLSWLAGLETVCCCCSENLPQLTQESLTDVLLTSKQAVSLLSPPSPAVLMYRKHLNTQQKRRRFVCRSVSAAVAAAVLLQWCHLGDSTNLVLSWVCADNIIAKSLITFVH